MWIFRQRYTARDGKVKKSGKWYVEFQDHNGLTHRMPAFEDKTATQSFAAKLERLISCRVGKESPNRELTTWLEGLPHEMRERFAALGLVDPRRAAAGKPLAKHVEDFEAALAGKGRTEKHVQMTVSRVNAIINGCHFNTWGDIDGNAVETFLADECKKDKGISARTRNGYLGAFKQFAGWMMKERRASESPVSHLGSVNATANPCLVRRALTAEESQRLIQAAQNGKPYGNMTGRDRAMLYRLTLESGLRWSELKSLTRESFTLDGDAPTVKVEAAYSKRRRDDSLPLRMDTARALRAYLAFRKPGERAFPMPTARSRGARMVRFDLAETKTETQEAIAAVDEAGRVLDFHALRHSFISALVNGGVHPKVAQTLARHSTIGLTMDRYTHLHVASTRGALDVLPNLAGPEQAAAGRAASA